MCDDNTQNGCAGSAISSHSACNIYIHELGGSYHLAVFDMYMYEFILFAFYLSSKTMTYESEICGHWHRYSRTMPKLPDIIVTMARSWLV